MACVKICIAGAPNEDARPGPGFTGIGHYKGNAVGIKGAKRILRCLSRSSRGSQISKPDLHLRVPGGLRVGDEIRLRAPSGKLHQRVPEQP